MKTTACSLAVLLAGLAPLTSSADEEKRAALATLAESKRGAALVLTTPKVRSLGVFVSKDGLALVHLQALGTEDLPAVLLADGASTKLAGVLGIFQDQELALVKVDHAPKLWLEISATEPAVGDDLALLPLALKDPWGEPVKAVAGEVMTKRSGMSTILRVPRFTKVLSLGAGLSPAQRGALGPGRFAIDGSGKLVAFTAGISPQNRQMMTLLAPVAALKAEVATLASSGQAIAFPLAEAINPIDPATYDREFQRLSLARMQQDWGEFQKIHERLANRYPGSPLVEANAGLLANPVIKEELPKAFDITAYLQGLVIEPEDSVAQKVSKRSARATFLQGQLKFEEALEQRKAAIELAPADYAFDRMMLANLYLTLRNLPEAEKTLRELYTFNSESVMVVEMLEHVLTQQDKLDEAREFTKRMYELERTYRSW